MPTVFKNNYDCHISGKPRIEYHEISQEDYDLLAYANDVWWDGYRALYWWVNYNDITCYNRNKHCWLEHERLCDEIEKRGIGGYGMERPYRFL